MMRLAVRAVRWLIFLVLLAAALAFIGATISGGIRHDSSVLWQMVMCVIAGVVPMMYGERPGKYGARMVAAMNTLAGEFGGRVEHTGFLDPDFDWRWTSGDARGHLNAWIDDFQSSGRSDNPPASARFRFRYAIEMPPGPVRMRLDVRPETVLQAAAKMFGMQDLSLGRPDIDRQLIVQASDRAEYERCLLRGLGPRLGDLVKMSDDMAVAHVSYAPGRLVVQRTCRITWDGAGEPQAVRSIHDTTVALLAAITGMDLEATAHGSAVGEVAVIAVAPEGAACLVCGQTIESGVVTCIRCETPHHCDCWDYNGGCALYACGSRQAQPVRVAGVT